MSKTIFLLNIGKYNPKITKITYPLIEYYANKIGADIVKITKRKYPDFPITYEKFQIYDLASSEWNIYIDSDTCILPEFYDLTPFMDKSVVYSSENNIAPSRYRVDKYFLRSNSLFSVPTNFVYTSDWCMDAWKPVDDLTLEEIKHNIYKVPRDFKDSKLCNDKFDLVYSVDDYLVSRNIAKYGLNTGNIGDIFKKIYGHSNLCYWSKYPLLSYDEKYRNLIIFLWENKKYFNWEEFGVKLPPLPKGCSYNE